MKFSRCVIALLLISTCVPLATTLAAEPNPAAVKRGKQALLFREFWPATFPATAYEDS